MRIRVNGSEFAIAESWRDETLLAVLREQLGLVGAKLGCGQGECGTCVVHINGQATRSCLVRASEVQMDTIITIEGLAGSDGELHPVQQAWLDERVAQCGFCQAGQIMQAAALLTQNPEPDDQAVTAHMSANLCRCGTYIRVRRAIDRAAALMRAKVSDKQ